jgi:group I intron endonuclease
MQYKYHYIYRTTNLINDKRYYGKHSTNDLGDDYLGSGIRLRRAIDKYGIANFSRTILAFFSSIDDLNMFESDFITQNKVDDPNIYNIATGGQGGDLGDKWRQKIRDGLARVGHPMLGHTHTQSARLKISKNHADISGSNNPRSKTIVVDDIEYDTITEASRKLNIGYSAMKYRLNDPKNTNYRRHGY